MTSSLLLLSAFLLPLKNNLFCHSASVLRVRYVARCLFFGHRLFIMRQSDEVMALEPSNLENRMWH